GRLGRGGMGVVYLARELRLDRRVAIKLLPPEQALQPTARQRFLREARTAAQLSHPGIVPIFAVHEVADLVYFAMAYVDGDTLGRRVRKRGPMPYDTAARLLEEVARALAYAHDRGVVHRDVKPDNILLDLATGRALVSDFGIARVGSGVTTEPQRVVGTAEFMSPEQVLGERVDPRSDLYSLGVAVRSVGGRGPAAPGASVGRTGRAPRPGRDRGGGRCHRGGAARGHGRARAPPAQSGIWAGGAHRCPARGAVAPARRAGVSLRGCALAARARAATVVLPVRC